MKNCALTAIKGLLAGWGKCSRTVLLDQYTRTLSYHNNTIAIGSRHGDIIILNAIMGSQIAIFSGYTAEVLSLMFSSDGALLVSGGCDRTAKLWDVQTGGVIKTFSGHIGWVWSVSISADCTTIASGSDNEICMWNTKTGECYSTMECKGAVIIVSFSPADSQHLISTASGEALQWDKYGHQIKHSHKGTCAAFSSEGTLLAIYHEGFFTVQSSDSGAVNTKFQSTGSDHMYCCFSPDNRFVAVAVNNAIYVWDISADPHLVETFIAHAYNVSGLAFSSPSSLISTSYDKLVKFWHISISSVEPTVANPKATPTTVPLVSSISLKARVGVVISSNTAGEMKTWDISTSDCKAPSQALAKYYRHRDTNLVNNRLILIWYTNNKISIWDIGKEEVLLQVNAPENTIVDLRISGDGSKLFYIHYEFIQVWDIWTGVTVDEVGYRELKGAELLAMDDLRMWVKFYNGFIPAPYKG